MGVLCVTVPPEPPLEEYQGGVTVSGRRGRGGGGSKEPVSKLTGQGKELKDRELA